MTNIREVAKAAEVSPSTVSRVLRGTVPVNDETRQRVIRAVERLKYRENELVQKACHVDTFGRFIQRPLIEPYYTPTAESPAPAPG
jgi:DNA-binding LacI/PurR family transcriptional regulator